MKLTINADLAEQPYSVQLEAEKPDGKNWYGSLLLQEGEKTLLSVEIAPETAPLCHVANGIAYLVFEDGVMVETNGSFIQIAVIRDGARAEHYHGSLVPRPEPDDAPSEEHDDVPEE